MSMYNFLQKNKKNNSENMKENNMVCIYGQMYRLCPDFCHNPGVFYESYILGFCIPMYKKIKRHTDRSSSCRNGGFFLYIFVFYGLLFYAVFNVSRKDIWTG